MRNSCLRTNGKWLEQQYVHADHDSLYAGISSLEKDWRSALLDSNFSEISRLLAQNPELANWKDYITGTALHFAAKTNDTSLVRLLAGTYKANVEAPNHGLTPLHMAALGACEEVSFELMSKYGAKASTRDYSGRLPVTYLPQTPAGVRLNKSLQGQLEKLLLTHPLLQLLVRRSIESEAAKPVNIDEVPISTVDRSEIVPPQLEQHSKTGCGSFNLGACGNTFRRKRSKVRMHTTKLPTYHEPEDWIKTSERAVLNRRSTIGDNKEMIEDSESCTYSNRRFFLKQQTLTGIESSNDNYLANQIYSSIKKRKELMPEKFNPQIASPRASQTNFGTIPLNPTLRHRPTNRTATPLTDLPREDSSLQRKQSELFPVP